jgi:hypothetical protein
MRHAAIIALAFLMGATFLAAPAECGTSVRVRFPAFALSPGERIMGVKLTASEGRIFAGCRPNRWTCDESGNSVHCYSLHPTYATAISGMLPEFIVRSSESGEPSFEASVEFIDNDGKEYSREIRAGDLIVK